MVNFNGNLVKESELQLSHLNRGFKYGDSIFETIKVVNGFVVFWEDHYFRLMASMRMLRMKIPMSFTLESLEEEILKITSTSKKPQRVRLSVFRKDGGFYKPKTNEVDFLLEASDIETEHKETYIVDLFKDYYNYSGLLSTVKTNNKIINTLASIYAEENDFDDCILLNERKNICETISGNVFLIFGNTVKTPSVQEGCLKGIMRKKVIDVVEKNPDYTLEEVAINPFELQKAEEVFITNSIIGVQPVTNYRKKQYKTTIGEKLQKNILLQETIAK